VSKKKDFSKLNVNSFFEVEAKEMLLANEVAGNLHKSKNIVATGNEVEIIVRNFFAGKLPTRYYVSNGHIVDKNLTVSSQLDMTLLHGSAA
jgi:phosphoribosylaminoimidazole-succinocarboxamide synthase